MHSLRIPPGTHVALGCLCSPLMTSRIFASLVLDGARRYAATLARIPKRTWEKGYQHLVAYKAKYGDTIVPRAYKTEDDFNLGHWVRNQRAANSKDTLSAEHTARLDALGFVWRVK